ncbi:MAG TPA: dienelactone hydrolase family protein [Pseudomonadales bacterium]|nr:dienelactone hydrolase family protein [Pseudomonadales bacterium]
MAELIAPFEPLDDFERRDITLKGKTRRVYLAGTGPAVIVMSEMPGIYYNVARFARWVRDAGFTVWMPHMFGDDGRPPSQGYMVRSMARACISREFHAFAANRSSPIVDWLRALAAQAFEECGGKGVGAIGMCFTGNFALNLMLEKSVLAPVLAQPSLPIMHRGGMHISPEELRCVRERLDQEDLTVLAYRFEGDKFCRHERFTEYQAALGDRFIATELPDEAAAADVPFPPHSVVTLHLIDEAGQPTRRAVDEILAFYRLRLT